MTNSEINLRDPFVLLWEGKYYLYGTRGATCWGPATGFDVYSGADLIHWDFHSPCFENDGTFWADQNYWAPEVHPWQGSFYLFASFRSETRRRGTAILRAESPLGPFRPWSEGPLTPADWECLDGTFYVDPDGNPWMVFCHEWVQAGDGEILALPLSMDLKTACGSPRLLFRASDAEWVKPVHHSSGVTGYVTDGPFLWRSVDQRLYCLWSSFSEGGYTQGLALSESGDIPGPWRQLPPLFTGDGGHGMLFRDLDGRILLAFHQPNQHLQERPRFLDVTEKMSAF